MRSIFLGVIALFLPCVCSAQIIYQKGYFITDQGQKSEYYILNEDWSYNPIGFKYRTTAEGETRTATLDEVSSFGIPGVFRYEKHLVPIELSSDNNATLNTNPKPEFDFQTVFLKVLSKGHATLYSYASNGKTQFYFRMGGEDIVPLVYKRYRQNGGAIGETTTFRQTLWVALDCENFNKEELKDLTYNEPQLKIVFDRFNRCKDEMFENHLYQKKPLIIKVGVRPGVSLSSAEFNSLGTSFDSQATFRLGAQVEVFLPVNRNKWSLVFEAAYRSFEDEQETTFYRSFVLDYTSIEFSLGVRHYFYLNTRHAIFLGAALLGDSDLDAEIRAEGSLQSDFAYEVEPEWNSGLSIGWSFDKTWSLEVRYDTGRNLLRDNQTEATFNNLNLILGYALRL